MSILLIEPIGDKTIRLVGKGLNAAIVLKPGEPQEIDSVLGVKLLKQCSKNIRVSRLRWMTSWQELASMTEGIAEEHPTYLPLQQAIDVCDKAFAQDDWSAFQRAFDTVRQLTTDSS